MSGVTLLDTDILSYLLRGQTTVVQRAVAYLESHTQLQFSVITRYEILRGLQARNATAQTARFDSFCQKHWIVAVDEAVIDRAAAIYADLYRSGLLISDADILIGATALVNGYTLATNNADHFGRINGLIIDNWAEAD